MKVAIHYARFDRPEELYTETLVRDDGVRVETLSDWLNLDFALEWSRRVWQREGRLGADLVVRQVRKYHFYGHWFNVLDLLDENGKHLAYYCDVVTPLVKINGEYYLQNLCLDLWIGPDGNIQTLDWEELERAALQGQISATQWEKAIETISWMEEEARRGLFPKNYLPVLGL